MEEKVPRTTLPATKHQNTTLTKVSSMKSTSAQVKMRRKTIKDVLNNSDISILIQCQSPRLNIIYTHVKSVQWFLEKHAL
jgi:hypothetical protein